MSQNKDKLQAQKSAQASPVANDPKSQNVSTKTQKIATPKKPQTTQSSSTPAQEKPQSEKQTSTPQVSTPATSAAAASAGSTVTDPAEAAAAAFNQPIYTTYTNGQYMGPNADPHNIEQMESNNNCSLYIGDLDPEVTEAQLYEVFNVFGPLSTIRVCKDARTRRSLGYSYVNFLNSASAAKALQTLNYQLLKNRPMRIMWVQRDPVFRKIGDGNIYIKNLDESIDSKTLHDTFKAFGKIMSCKVVTDEYGSKGYGYIHFEEPESAACAIQSVNGMLLNDRKVFVGPHIHKKDRLSKQDAITQKFNNIYVKNISPDIDEEGLKEMFSKFGSITSAIISRDEKGKSRGFGFVCFEQYEDAGKAVSEMHDTVHNDKLLYVRRAQKKSEREQELKQQYEQFKEEKLKKYRNINLYIKNLDDSITDEKLHEEFSNFGVITSAKVMRDEKTGVSKGFGFVCFSSPEEATRAVTEMNGRVLVSKPIYAALAQRKEVRKAQIAAQLMQRNRMRSHQVAEISDFYQPSAMMYHPQGFMQQPQAGAPYVPGVGMMHPRWMPPQQQVHLAPTMSGPIHLPSVHPATQPRPQRQFHNHYGRMNTTPNSNQQMMNAAIPLVAHSMSPRKVHAPGFPPVNPSGGPAGPGPVMPQQAPKTTASARPVMATNSKTATQMHPQIHLDVNRQQPYPVPDVHPVGSPYNIASLILDPDFLSTIPPVQHKRILGEALFSAVHRISPQLEGKVTGMLLEMDNNEIISILKDPAKLKMKVQEALKALEEHKRQQQRQKSASQNQYQQQPAAQNAQSQPETQTQSSRQQPQQKQKQRVLPVTKSSSVTFSGHEATEATA